MTFSISYLLSELESKKDLYKENRNQVSFEKLEKSYNKISDFIEKNKNDLSANKISVLDCLRIENKIIENIQKKEKDNDKKVNDSANKAQLRIKIAFESLLNIRTDNIYKRTLRGLSESSFDGVGLPKDGFRAFANGQKAALNNTLRTFELDSPIRKFYECRVSLISEMEKKYIHIQKKLMTEIAIKDSKLQASGIFLAKTDKQTLQKVKDERKNIENKSAKEHSL